MAVPNGRHLQSNRLAIQSSVSPAALIGTGASISPLARTDDADCKIGKHTSFAPRPSQNGIESASILDSPVLLLSKGLQCQQAGRLTEAVALFDQLLRLKFDLPGIHCNRGAALAGLGRFDDAAVSYRRAIALNQDFAEAYNNLGIALCELGSFDEAERALRQAIRLKPESPQCYTNLGHSLRCQGRFADAEAAHRKAIALNPSFPDAYNSLGEVLGRLGRLDEAETAHRYAIALEPQFADAFSSLAKTLSEQGRLDEAEAACRQAITLDPDHVLAHYNLGTVLEKQARLSEAEVAYRRAIALKPNYADAHNNLGVTLKHLGRLADARRSVERAVQLAPRNALHLLSLSDLKQFSVGDAHFAAMEELAQTIQSFPAKDQIELHFALAKAYADVGRRDDAFRQLLEGNALKRLQISYDESATLAEFDRIQAVFTPDLIKKFQNAGEPSSAPLFIVGMPRSGTTLVEQILASHPQVFGAGELLNLSKGVTSIRSTGGYAVPFPEVVLTISGEDLQRFGARYVAEITRLAPTATHVINKMPSNFLFAGLIHLMLPNARIIHAVRDPVDTCVSCFSKLFATAQYFTYDLGELGRYYRCYQKLMQYWRNALPPGRILDVQYEDVVTDLEGQARCIIDHCGLDWDTRCLAFHKSGRPVQTASASQVRQPLYRTAIGRAQPYAPFLRPLLAELSGSS